MTVVLLSGGQDSGTLLYDAVEHDEGVVALHLQYGQRHAVERHCAAWLASDAGVPLDVLELGPLIAELTPQAPLTHLDAPDTFEAVAGPENPYAQQRGLPSSFVPGRNLFLLGAAATWVVVRGHDDLITGICANDRAGYPDCRAEFIDSFGISLRWALDVPEFRLIAPLLGMTKAETWQLAERLGVLEQIVEHTHTCYRGERNVRHRWGYGCGACPACLDRGQSWQDAFESLPTG